MIRLKIDGTYYETTPGRNLLEFCLSLGIDIPHFCYHPAMGSVGACRLCAVKRFMNEEDKKGMIIMSCLTYAKEEMIISTNDPEVLEFRDSIIENLMTNHPHDCPVCDEGGECHLQDMTVMTGHNYRRFKYEKRTHVNQYLGPFIKHEMNRCIQCYRCVRFYKDYAGGKDFGVFGSASNVYFGRHKEGTLESEFSGNLVEVCPTGVFTDKTFGKHYARKWDLTHAPSVCVHCSAGCNIIVSERYGSLRRVMNRYNGSVNGYFICDRGRFGYEFVNDEKRIRNIRICDNEGKQAEVKDSYEILLKLSAGLKGNTNTVGIGSPRASLEANFALRKLVGEEHFYHGISRRDHEMAATAVSVLKSSNVHSPSMKDICSADVIFIIDEDLINTAPMVGLAVKRAASMKSYAIASEFKIQSWHHSAIKIKSYNARFPVFIASTHGTRLDDIASVTYEGNTNEIRLFAGAVRAFLSDENAKVEGCEKYVNDIARFIAKELRNAKNPLIITGTSHGTPDLLHAASELANALSPKSGKAMLSVVLPECNSTGLALMGGRSMEDLNAKEIDNLIILENDLYHRAEKGFVDDLMKNSKNIIILDSIENRTTAKAHIVLPAATFAESEGTLVNNEGRAQRHYKAIVPQEPVMESWRWLDEIRCVLAEGGEPFKNYDAIVKAMVSELPVFAKIREYMPSADFRMHSEKIPRQTRRYSGRTAMNANMNVSEPPPVRDADSPLAFSMEGYSGIPESSLIPFYWAPKWNSVQAFYKYIPDAHGPLPGGDPGVRLFDGGTDGSSSVDTKSPVIIVQQQDDRLIVPVFRIFGSEELSAKAPAIAGRIPEACVLMNSIDAETAGFKTNDILELTIDDHIIFLPLKTDDSFADGVAGIIVQLPDAPYITLPAWGKINKA